MARHHIDWWFVTVWAVILTAAFAFWIWILHAIWGWIWG